MKTNKKVQKNSVQKSEKENAVKVTALAVIPKPIMLLTPQDVPTATEVTAPLETATVPTVTEETPQQVTFKTPLATATAETDLDITTVQPSTDNHRKTFNDASLQELAESIREVGVLQAIAVRPHTGGGYEIIYGERRYRASLLAGAKTIKATIYNNVTDDEAEDIGVQGCVYIVQHTVYAAGFRSTSGSLAHFAVPNRGQHVQLGIKTARHAVHCDTGEKGVRTVGFLLVFLCVKANVECRFHNSLFKLQNYCNSLKMSSMQASQIATGLRQFRTICTPFPFLFVGGTS